MGNVHSSLTKKIADLERMSVEVPDEAGHGIEDVLDDMVNTMRSLVLEQGAVASTALIRSLRWKKVSVTRSNVGTPSKHVSYKVKAGGTEFNAGHAPFVEFGTGDYNRPTSPKFVFEAPSGVPLDNIQKWMKQKGIGDDPATAWAIKRHIEKHGTKAQPFFRRAVNIHVDSGAMSNVVEKRIDKVLKRYN